MALSSTTTTEQTSPRAGGAWPIRAEVGLYIFYLALAVPLDGLRTVCPALCVVTGLSIVGTVFIGGYASGFWLGRLPQQDWWLSLSPICRVPEFLLGALIAQYYLIRNARWTGFVGGCWIVASFAACYVFSNFQASFGFAPGVAAVMFYFAYYRSRATVLIETPIMLVLGEASYSIYNAAWLGTLVCDEAKPLSTVCVTYRNRLGFAPCAHDHRLSLV